MLGFVGELSGVMYAIGIG